MAAATPGDMRDTRKLAISTHDTIPWIGGPEGRAEGRGPSGGLARTPLPAAAREGLVKHAKLAWTTRSRVLVRRPLLTRVGSYEWSH